MIDTQTRQTGFQGISQLTKPDNTKVFFEFRNSDQKRWLIPATHMRTGFNLYQPSGLKGKLLRAVFPLAKRFRSVQKIAGAEINHCRLKEELHRVLCEAFGVNDLEFSLFGGTPSKHQKITIQLFRGKKILGYAKISDNEEIIAYFRHEQNLLDKLNQKGIINTPRCVCLKEIGDGQTIFVQDSQKSNRSKVVHRWTNQHWSFLTGLHEKTAESLSFEKSDFYASMIRLEQHIAFVPELHQATITEVLRNVIQHYQNKTVAVCFYHGDFTPWNTFMEKGKLFVFDFEYAQQSYPPYLDWFHFFTQVSIFKHHLNSDQIITRFQAKQKELSRYFPDPSFAYRCYLLDIISFFTNRDQGRYTNDVQKNLKTWCQLIDKL